MRKLVIFLLILTIPIGFFTGATKTLDALKDDVEITPVHVYGDPARVEGLQVQLLTTLNEHVWWTTDYTAGETGASDTTFHFSQEVREYEPEIYWGNFELYGFSGGGMSMGGGEGFSFDERTALGAIAQALSDKAQSGETVTEEVLLEDYTDTYPLDYHVSIQSGGYYIEKHLNGFEFETEFYDSEEMDGYRRWTELFRFPVQPGQKVEVSLTKDYDGQVRDINFEMIGPEIEFVSHIADAGMFFVPRFIDAEGKPLTTGEYPMGYGLYYIPFKPGPHIDMELVEDLEIVDGDFDFDHLELVYGLDDTDQILMMQADTEKPLLHMLTLDDGMYVYCSLNLTTRQMVSRVEIMPNEIEEPRAYSCEFFSEQELLYLWHNGRVALVDISDTPNVEFVIDWPVEYTANLPEKILYRDGVLYMTCLDWNVDGQVFVLAACDADGLGYYGYCQSNLREPDELGSGGSYINMEEVAFLE